MSSSCLDAPVEPPPLPDKVRGKPQRKGNIGVGKLYVDEAAFLADVELWEAEKVQRKCKRWSFKGRRWSSDASVNLA